MPPVKIPLMGIVTFSEDYGPAVTFEAKAVDELIKRAGLKSAGGLDLISVGRNLSRAVSNFIVYSAKRSSDADNI